MTKKQKTKFKFDDTDHFLDGVGGVQNSHDLYQNLNPTIEEDSHRPFSKQSHQTRAKSVLPPFENRGRNSPNMLQEGNSYSSIKSYEAE